MSCGSQVSGSRCGVSSLLENHLSDWNTTWDTPVLTFQLHLVTGLWCSLSGADFSEVLELFSTLLALSHPSQAGPSVTCPVLEVSLQESQPCPNFVEWRGDSGQCLDLGLHPLFSGCWVGLCPGVLVHSTSHSWVLGWAGLVSTGPDPLYPPFLGWACVLGALIPRRTLALELT